MALTRIRRRSTGARRPRPSRARLLASVAPDVKITSSGSPPMSDATVDKDAFTASAADHPTTWSLEWGLPKASRQKGVIFSKTRGVNGRRCLIVGVDCASLTVHERGLISSRHYPLR